MNGSSRRKRGGGGGGALRRASEGNPPFSLKVASGDCTSRLTTQHPALRWHKPTQDTTLPLLPLALSELPAPPSSVSPPDGGAADVRLAAARRVNRSEGDALSSLVAAPATRVPCASFAGTPPPPPPSLASAEEET